MISVLTLLALATASAQTVTVCALDSCDFAELQSALSAEPDVIRLADGRWEGSFVVSNPVRIEPIDRATRPVIACTTGAAGNTIAVQPSAPRDAAALITGMTLEPCKDGRALLLTAGGNDASDAGHLDVTDVVFDDPAASNGPAEGGFVRVGKYARLRLQDSELGSRMATSAGAHVFVSSGAELRAVNTTFADGLANLGGSIYVAQTGKAWITHSAFTNNTAFQTGGAIQGATPSVLFLADDIFEGNGAQRGGAISMASYTTPIEATIQRSTFDNNHSDLDGGALYLRQTDLTLVSSTFKNHQITGRGGAIFGYGVNLSLIGSDFVGNSAKEGGAVFMITEDERYTLEVQGSHFAENRSDRNGGGNGGAIHVEGLPGPAYVPVRSSRFVENVASLNGGALYLKSAEPAVTSSYFHDNSSKAGGAVDALNVLTGSFTDSYWCSNFTNTSDGGALRVHGGDPLSSLVVEWNTFAGNRSATTGAGLLVNDVAGLNANNNHFVANSNSGFARAGSAAQFISSGGDAQNNLMMGGIGQTGFWASDSTVAAGAMLGFQGAYSTHPDFLMDGMINATLYQTHDPKPVKTWVDGGCEEALWSEQGNGAYGWGNPPPSQSNPWPVGAYHADIFTSDGSVDIDGDGVSQPDDCDDRNPTVHPNISEDTPCDGIDTDCSEDCSNTEEGCAPGELLDGATLWYADLDGDGLGDPASELLSCGHPGAPFGTLSTSEQWYVSNADDCDDADAAVTGKVGLWPDADNDGYGASTDPNGEPVEPTEACLGPGLATEPGDCDDDRSEVSPAEPELCDGFDNDCDGTVDVGPDEGGGEQQLPDADNDGYSARDASAAISVCPGTEGWTDAANTGDCDDADSGRFPGNKEVCDGIDSNCNGVPDEAEATDRQTYFLDTDDDNYGDPDAKVLACQQRDDLVENSDDCDDTRDDVRPGAQEVCDALDNDCDELVDNDASDALDGFLDDDEDGVGGSSPARACAYGSGVVPQTGDCDDDNDLVAPGFAEVCDGFDNDCNGAIDDDPEDGELRFDDEDLDGFGREPLNACAGAPETADVDGDCNDQNPEVHPEAGERCDEVDWNCDGDALAGAESDTTGFLDADGDGYGAPGTEQPVCSLAGDTVDNDQDCDDENPDSYPGAPDPSLDCLAEQQFVVFVSGGCQHTPSPAGFLAFLPLALIRRKR